MDFSQYPKYELRRKFWKFFGAEISIFPENSTELAGFIKMKAFKLREDVRLYRDKTQSQELLAIQARQIIDFGATYDVTDSATGAAVMSLRRKGFRSAFVRDTWEILDPAGTVVGRIQETSGNLALVRRWLGLISDLFDLVFAFVAQTYEIRLGADGSGDLLASVTHTKNPFVVKMDVDQSMSPSGTDPRIVLASTALLAIVDAAKNN